MASHSYKTILKKIILKLGFGFKKDRIEACLGEEIPLQLDESLFKDNVKRAKKNTLKNSFARWFTGDGSEITDSKTVQDDEGNTETKVNLNGKTLSNNITNNAQTRNSNAKQEIRTNGNNSGSPFVHWSINGQRDFSAGIDNDDDDAFKICKQYFLDQNHFFRIGSDGNNTHPFQYSAFAILGESTGNIASGGTYYLGQGKPLTIIDNEGGNFFPGAGNNPSRPAMFTCKEAAKYLVYISAVIQIKERKDAEIQAAFSVETKKGTKRNTGAINIVPSAFGKNTATVLGEVKADIGDTIKFYIYTTAQGSSWNIKQTIGATYTTFVGVYCLG